MYQEQFKSLIVGKTYKINVDWGVFHFVTEGKKDPSVKAKNRNDRYDVNSGEFAEFKILSIEGSKYNVLVNNLKEIVMLNSLNTVHALGKTIELSFDIYDIGSNAGRYRIEEIKDFSPNDFINDFYNILKS